MNFTNSPLIVHTDISPNTYGLRNRKIDTITPHIVSGHMSLKSLGLWFKNKDKKASSNYGIDDNGNIGMFLEEKYASCCSSNVNNDRRAITIEIASDRTHPYAITEAAEKGLIKLCVDICKRNNIPKLFWKADKNLIGKIDQQNITVHRWFKNKACPGDYLYNKLDKIVCEVNKILLNQETIPSKPATIPSKPTNSKITLSNIPYKIQIVSDIVRYRKGPSINYPIVGQVLKNEIYTIVQESFGLGSSKWGKLKSGSGWVPLDQCIKMR
jgi:hypothetical protein